MNAQSAPGKQLVDRVGQREPLCDPGQAQNLSYPARPPLTSASPGCLSLLAYALPDRDTDPGRVDELQLAEVEDEARRVSGLDAIQLPLKHEARGEIEFAR